MTAKDFVLHKYPKARAERQVQGGRVKGAGKPYWLIRPEIHKMYIGSGDTESKAWKDAKERIVECASTDQSDLLPSTDEGNPGTQKSPFGPGA